MDLVVEGYMCNLVVAFVVGSMDLAVVVDNRDLVVVGCRHIGR